MKFEPYQRDKIVDALEVCWSKIKKEVPGRLQKRLAKTILHEFRELGLFTEMPTDEFAEMKIYQDSGE